MAGRENILMGVSYLHPIFFSGFSATAFCNLRNAIDFAELRMRSCGAVAKQLEERALDATPLSTPQPTTQIFKQLFLQLHSARHN